MTEQQARKTANAVLAVAAIGAAIYILKTPSLRRMAWNLTKLALTSQVPGWLAHETRTAWRDSARGEMRGI
jgi:hypothetical protein